MANVRAQLIRSHSDLDVYQLAFGAAISIFELSKSFPKEERYSLTDQIRRSSRSVCANLAEAWRKRCYEAAFISKVSDSEAETAETQVWLQFAVKSGYLSATTARPLYKELERIIGMLVRMRTNSNKWILK